jgi:exodeoxyribonuclease VII large subunit
VSACGTPVISAIGHEPDTPLLDHVADLRCSTPTDAGKRVVPDVAEETHRIRQLRDRTRRALHGWVDRERRLLDALRSRPALADPFTPLRRRADEVTSLRDRGRREIRSMLSNEQSAQSAIRSRLTTLGPAATLARGYAVVQSVADDGATSVLRSVDDAAPGTRLRVRLVDGAIRAVVPDDDTRERR